MWIGAAVGCGIGVVDECVKTLLPGTLCSHGNLVCYVPQSLINQGFYRFLDDAKMSILSSWKNGWIDDERGRCERDVK